MTDVETLPAAEEAWFEAQIGRYVFRRLVGSGGMGIVVAAHDPDLDREVAIKIVVTGDSDEARPVREAQAMARLSHPNVVQVYEVIRLGVQTAIVMQLVEGEELGVWQASEPRSWREIVDAYVQASRGLAAAHRAGLVHGDFKPANALIDRDGIVRVTRASCIGCRDHGGGWHAGVHGARAASRRRHRRPHRSVVSRVLVVRGSLQEATVRIGHGTAGRRGDSR